MLLLLLLLLLLSAIALKLAHRRSIPLAPAGQPLGRRA